MVQYAGGARHTTGRGSLRVTAVASV